MQPPFLHRNSPTPQWRWLGVTGIVTVTTGIVIVTGTVTTPSWAGGTLRRGQRWAGDGSHGRAVKSLPGPPCTWGAAQQVGAQDDAVVEVLGEDADVPRLNHAAQQPHRRGAGIPVTLEELGGEGGQAWVCKQERAEGCARLPMSSHVHGPCVHPQLHVQPVPALCTPRHPPHPQSNPSTLALGWPLVVTSR